MVAELCPNGVEFRELGEVCTSITAGGDLPENYQKGQSLPSDEFPYPIYSNGSEENALYGYTDTFRIAERAVTISARGTIGFHAVREAKFTPIVRLLVLIPSQMLTPEYLNYVLSITEITHSGGSIPQLTVPNVRKIRIPIPPLPIQQEIVRVLDKFSQLVRELQANLQAELVARRKQYQYYRDQLLSFEGRKDVRWGTLGEICTSVSSGGTPLSTRPDYYGGDIPWLRTQEVRYTDIYDTEIRITEKGLKESGAKWIPANCVIVAISGATAARSAINKIPLTTNQHCCNLEINPDQANYRYVFYWVSKEYEKLKALGQGTRRDLSSGVIKSYPIPIPSLEVQQEIVSILDKFDALVNDLCIGLPAEIAARQKQYEYYRDRLLTFPEAARTEVAVPMNRD
ncbi:MAG: restriction endonuclease subunit S [Chlorobi bacterium]|nr:restriction endonuclease subunit S [Chlorobiota bacterium]MBX7217387.1 restriction endonuclease subunit S [Candidatus Kapabacteria bacterium]